MMPGRLPLAMRVVLSAALVAAVECARLLLLDASRAVDMQPLLPWLPVSLLIAFAHDAVALSEWLIIVAAAYAATAYSRRRRDGIGIGLAIGFGAGCVVGATRLAVTTVVTTALESATLRQPLREGDFGQLALTVGGFCAAGVVSGAIGAYRALR